MKRFLTLMAMALAVASFSAYADWYVGGGAGVGIHKGILDSEDVAYDAYVGFGKHDDVLGAQLTYAGGRADFGPVSVKGMALMPEAVVRLYGNERLRWFLSGGGAYWRAKFSDYKDDGFGWTAGTGVDWKFTDSWTARAQYRYVDRGNSGVIDTHYVSIGVAYNF